MKCQEALENLLDFMEGTLSPELRMAIEEHVDSCRVCPTFVDSYRKTTILCQKALQRAAPPEVVDRLLSALRDRTSKSNKG